MFYEFKRKKLKKISFNKIKRNNIVIGYISLDILEKIYLKLNIDKNIIDLCNNSNKYLKNISLIEDNLYFDIINIRDNENIKNNLGRIGILIKNNLYLIIIIEDNNLYINNIIEDIFNSSNYLSSFDIIISKFIDKAVLNSFNKIEYFDKKIINIENEIFKKNFVTNLNPLIFSIKKELNLYKLYFDYILNFINDFKINFEGKLKYINHIENKVSKLDNNIEYLIESCIHLREIYQSTIDFYQNKIIKTLTLLTTIFLPLSLITGWYGMNFEHMPEIHSKYSYPIITFISLIILVGLIIVFKKKKII